MKPGRLELKDWMNRRNFAQHELAEYLGMDETTVSKLLKGTRNPGLENAVAIERKTGIPVEAWMPTGGDTSVASESPELAKRPA